MEIIQKGKNIWLLMFGLVLLSNLALYHTAFGKSVVLTEPNAVVLGSLFDLILVLPVLFMMYKRKFSVKLAICLSAGGCVAARLLIPVDYVQPFTAATSAGIAVEMALVLLEIFLILTFFRNIPKILKEVSYSALPVVFSFPQAVDHYVKNKAIVNLLCSESLMFYYAFFSWKKNTPNGITLYKKSSYIAFQIMLIHAIIIETLGIHWWLHEKAMIVSIILLVFNVYSVFFLLADIQSLRLNPIHISDQSMYLSFGLQKRAEINFAYIEKLEDNPESLQQKLSKDTLVFVAQDFEQVYPDMILHMKKPVKAILFMGIEREYSKIALRSDQSAELKHAVLEGIRKCAISEE
ncbi:beta-carotene 15,15'-monooxygenase [Mesobacillus zeae]|uniref:Beta-carotene 15,15'-monooxygenase n=1 Tax=Mesobacillus zeae TaxID=1917180 RepID=A0A398BCL0_9BACI|nr:beta-carotene 15,15'-monooxygenase [Mesobacillus zeae]RID85550.1 beta-carotene 15,15'-monooxygenase [Mesobacillus zeae]